LLFGVRFLVGLSSLSLLLLLTLSFAPASSAFGVILSIRVGLVNDILDHDTSSLSANFLDQTFFDKGGSEMNGSSSSQLSIFGSNFPGLMSS